MQFLFLIMVPALNSIFSVAFLFTLSFTLSRIFSCKTQKFVRLSKFQKSPKNLDISTIGASDTKLAPTWLGWQDSNLRMQQSKCCVLPLDDTPICNFIRKTPPKRLCASAEFPMGWNIGFEPMVSSATNWRFNQLS